MASSTSGTRAATGAHLSLAGRGPAANVIPIRPDDPSTWDAITPCMAGHHLLYRFYDRSGRLLYIGITWTPRERWRRHRRLKDWWPEVASVTVECFPAEWLALNEELRVIKAERPVHNRRGAVAA